MSTDDPSPSAGRRLDAASVFASLQRKLAYFESPIADPRFHSRTFADRLCLEMETIALRIAAYVRSNPKHEAAGREMERRLDAVHKRALRRRDDLDQ
jgi:hypothetical protein